MDSPLVAGLIAACQWDTTRFFIVSGNVFDPFIYYSHLLPTALSLAIGFFVFRHNRSLLGKILLAITVLFSVFTFFDLILWATDRPEFTMFFWSMANLIEPMIYAAGLYFVYVVATGKDISFRLKLLILLPLIPTILLAPTSLNLASFDLSNCDREALEGPLAFYNYGIEIFYAVWVLAASAVFMKRDKQQRGQIALSGLGMVVFMLSMAWSNIVGSLTVDWQIPQWGFLGMPVFLGFLAYLIVRYNVFHFKVVGAQLLTFVSVVFVGSLFLAPTIGVAHVLIVPTMVLLSVSGVLLVRSVKREVDLARNLEQALNFISHDVKGALTQGHGTFSEILQGDFGEISAELAKVVAGLDDSMKKTIDMTTTVLRARDAKTGRIQYDMKPFDLKQALLEAVDYVKPQAQAKNLSLDVTVPQDIDGTVVGDRGLIAEHVLRNLLANAVIYTPQGSVHVTLSRQPGSIRMAVKDSGVGITPEDKARLFTEGGKGKDSTKTNVHSTGYGLYLAKTVVEAHQGRIWAESEGPSKGSTFVVEFPLSGGDSR